MSYHASTHIKLYYIKSKNSHVTQTLLSTPSPPLSHLGECLYSTQTIWVGNSFFWGDKNIIVNNGAFNILTGGHGFSNFNFSSLIQISWRSGLRRYSVKCDVPGSIPKPNFLKFFPYLWWPRSIKWREIRFRRQKITLKIVLMIFSRLLNMSKREIQWSIYYTSLTF